MYGLYTRNTYYDVLHAAVESRVGDWVQRASRP